MIELAERPADTTTPNQPGGWYDPDSSAFEPLAVAAPSTNAVAAGLEPAGTGYRVSAVERAAGETAESRSGLPTRRTTSSV